MAGAGERSLPHGHGGDERRERDGQPGSSLLFFSTAVPPAPQGPRPDAGDGPGNGKRRPIPRPEVRKGLGMGPGACDPRPTAAEGGRGREEGGK